MRNKSKLKADYKLLKRKIFWKIILITGIALLATFFLLLITSGRIADTLVALFQRIFGFSYEDALTFYHNVFRRNMDFIVILPIPVFFVILSRYLLAQFGKYFNQVSNGLDTLVAETNDEITLSPEMEPMESKIKAIKETLLKREQEVQITKQRKNDLVMYLAHDIKTPLTSVIGYLSLLDEAPDMPARQKAKYVNITLEKAYRLEKLVDEFFEISRFDFEADTMEKEEIDLYYMLAQMADEFYPLLTTGDKRILLDMAENIKVYGDPDKLARVFNNIIKNAIAYSLDNSSIEITAKPQNNMLAVIFRNSGSIPKNKLASIFDRFYRLDSARSSDKGGAGLGLAIAKEIILAHGGKVYADSDDKHTTFMVELPVMEEQP